MSVIGVVAVRVMQADIDTKIDLVVLRIPPTGVNDLIGVCRGIDRPVRNALVDAIVTIVIHPGTQAIRPIRPGPGIADSRLWRWRARRGWGRAILARFIASEPNDPVIEGVVGTRMIEDRFLRSTARIGRIKKWCNRLKRRERTFRRRAAHTEEDSTKQKGYQDVFR